MFAVAVVDCIKMVLLDNNNVLSFSAGPKRVFSNMRVRSPLRGGKAEEI